MLLRLDARAEADGRVAVIVERAVVQELVARLNLQGGIEGLERGLRPGVVFVDQVRSEEHTSELQSLMRISYAVFCLKKKNHTHVNHSITKNTVYTLFYT